jgi:hypothetical protein
LFLHPAAYIANQLPSRGVSALPQNQTGKMPHHRLGGLLNRIAVVNLYGQNLPQCTQAPPAPPHVYNFGGRSMSSKKFHTVAHLNDSLGEV